MSLIIIGEAVMNVMDGYAEFAQAHAQVPCGTVQAALPELLKQLPAVRQDADDEDRNDEGMEP